MASTDDIARLRMLSQQIGVSRNSTPEEIVHTLGAMQAQDYNAALWAIGVRLPGSTQSRIEQAIAAHLIVRSWPMRGTLHFVDAKDRRWMLQLLAPRVLGNTERRDRQLGLDQATYTRCSKLLQRKLRGIQLPRDEVYQLLERAGISTEGQRGYHILWHLAQQEVICFSVQNGKQPTFALLDDWVPETKRLARDEALDELTMRYFNGHGPATAEDFSAWSKLSLTEARRGVERVRGHLQQIHTQETTYWMSRTLTDTAATPAAVILPAFDEYLLGYKDRSAVLEAKYADRIVPGANGVFRPLLVLHGRVVGTWKGSVKKGALTVTRELFGKLTKTELGAFDKATEQYAEFVGLPLS